MTVGGNINNLDARNAILNNLALQQAGTQQTTSPFANLIAVQNLNAQNNLATDNTNPLLAAQALAQIPAGTVNMNGFFTGNTNVGTVSIEDYSNSLAYIAGVTEQVGQVGYQSAESSAYYSYLDAVNNYYGQTQQNQLNEYASRANVALDLEQLALRNNYGIMQKQMEMYVLDAQVREKLMGTFYEIEKVKLDNTFQRAKQLVQSAKY